MSFTRIEESLLLAAWFRGGDQADVQWTSNCDQVVTLSLFYTGDIAREECAARFETPGYLGGVYDETGELKPEIGDRYKILVRLLQEHGDLIEGAGNFDHPAHPTFTACRLTNAGCQLARSVAQSFPSKPVFPQWPDRRANP